MHPPLHNRSLFSGMPNTNFTPVPSGWKALQTRFIYNPLYLPRLPFISDDKLALAITHPVGPAKKRSREVVEDVFGIASGGDEATFRALAWIGDAVLLTFARVRLVQLCPGVANLDQVNVSFGTRLAH